MYCNNCGNNSPNAGRFCPHCGAPYSTTNTEPQPQQNFAQQNQGQSFGNAYQQPTEYNQAAPYVAPASKKSNAPVITLVIAIIFITVFGVFMLLEASGVTEVTGWFNNDDTEISVSEKGDKGEEEANNSSAKDEANDSNAKDEEFDETIVNPDKKKHEYDKYSETRTSDDDGESEFSYSDEVDTENKEEKNTTEKDTSSSTDEAKVAKFVETYKKSYVSPETDETIETSMEARGTSVVCCLKFKTDVPSGTDASLKKEMETDEVIETYESLLSIIKAQEPAITSLFFECRDKNGNVLYSREYK